MSAKKQSLKPWKHKAKAKAKKRVKKEITLETYDNFDMEMTELQICKAKISRLEKELSILREISGVTDKNFELNKLLERFLEIIMSATGAESGSILLLDRLSDTLEFTVTHGKKDAALKGMRLKMGEGIAGWVAQCGKPIITPDVKNDPRFNPAVFKAVNYATRNIVCAPLKFEDDIFGVIELLNKHQKLVFDQEDLNILLSFIPYISVIIKNAQLFIENKKRIHRLEHLMELTKYVNSVLDLNALFEKILAISTDTLTAESGSIMLVDEEKGDLTFAASTGIETEKLKETRLAIGDGIAGWVARENKPVLVADAQNDPRFCKRLYTKNENKIKSIIAVPLKTKDKVIGVIEVVNKNNNESFNEEDVDMLEALSNQAAVAIENGKLYTNLRELFINTVRSLVVAIETKDVYTSGHSERVTLFAEMIAEELGFTPDELEKLNLAATLHDIGKIGIDDAILRKPSKLTPAEYGEIKKHPGFAANILDTVPQLKDIMPAVRHHHERYDGLGYPDGLKGEDIPYFARIIAVADTFDAMNSSRPYRQAQSFNVCLEELKRCAGTQFDPEITAAAVKALKRWHAVPGKKEKEN
jgi:HD-GYP domain-containing protein (c-di-GMP phosphodiesterase class II)